MKWITIDKAKPKFGQDYLCLSGGRVFIGTLGVTKQTASGVVHEFDSEEHNPKTVTHIAAITLPEKEVTNG